MYVLAEYFSVTIVNKVKVETITRQLVPLLISIKNANDAGRVDHFFYVILFSNVAKLQISSIDRYRKQIQLSRNTEIEHLKSPIVKTISSILTG